MQQQTRTEADKQYVAAKQAELDDFKKFIREQEKKYKKDKMSNITVIIPVHEVQNNMSDLLKKSVNSVASQKTKPKDIEVIPGIEEIMKQYIN